MDGLKLLIIARRLRLDILISPNGMRLRGPRYLDPLARLVVASKPAIIRLVNAEGVCEQVCVVPDWLEAVLERAAIMEFDGGLDRSTAEQEAIRRHGMTRTGPDAYPEKGTGNSGREERMLAAGAR